MFTSVKMHALVSILSPKLLTVAWQQLELAFFGAWLRLRAFLFTGDDSRE